MNMRRSTLTASAWRSMPAVVGFACLHFLVDGLCACCLYLMAPVVSVTGLVGVFVLYNVLAFLTQPLTGMLADRARFASELLPLAVAFLALGVAVAPFSPFSSFVPIAGAGLLGMGNSLFHVVGGKHVAAVSGNDIRALGVFVSPGALGLAVGIVFHSWPLLFALLLTAALGIRLVPLNNIGSRADALPVQSSSKKVPAHYAWLAVLCLMGVVMLRSLAGEYFTKAVQLCKESVPLGGGAMLAVAAVAAAGKAGGGWLAHWLGIVWSMLLVVAGVALTLSVPAGGYALAGLFLVNLTMPVTLWLANAVMPAREGLAFGLLAAALMPGYLLAQTGGGGSLLPGLLLTLVPTILIELCVLLALRERRADVLCSSVAVNMLTNVPLNLCIMLTDSSFATILAAEVIVVSVETLWYRYFVNSWQRALAYGFLCNAVSFLIGVLCQLLLKLFAIL